MKNYIDRVKYGSLLLLISIFGIPFIPFVPFVVLFGGFNLKTTNGIDDMLGSIGAAAIVGSIVYVAAAIVLLRNAFN